MKTSPLKGYVACHIALVLWRATMCGGPLEGRPTRWAMAAIERPDTPHMIYRPSRMRSTASVGLKRVPGREVTPARSRLRRIIAASASAYRCVVLTCA
jgi:hypothetical protein